MLQHNYVSYREKKRVVQAIEGLSDEAFRVIKENIIRRAQGKLQSGGFPPCDMGTLDELHSEAWLKILSNAPRDVNQTFIANKMVWLYQDVLKVRRAERRAQKRFAQRQAGKRYVRSTLESFVADSPPDVRAVMKLKLKGYTHQEIAADLSISKRTVNYRIKTFRERPTMPSAFETYKMFVDMKLHFTETAFVYGVSASNATEATFAKRRDYYQFEKLSRRYSVSQMRDVMVATFLKKPEAFIYDLLEPSADERYVDWRRRIESLTYCFKRDCDEIFTWVESNDMSFGDLFVSTNNRAPIIVKMATERRIALETVVVFDKLLAFMKRAAGKVSGEDWVHMYRTITKYAHFVECDVPKMRALVRNTLDNEFPSLRSGRLATSTTTYPRGGAGHANGLILL